MGGVFEFAIWTVLKADRSVQVHVVACVEAATEAVIGCPTAGQTVGITRQAQVACGN